MKKTVKKSKAKGKSKSRPQVKPQPQSQSQRPVQAQPEQAESPVRQSERQEVMKVPALGLVVMVVVAVLLAGGLIWALTRGSESQPASTNSNNTPSTLKVINSKPTDAPKNQAAPSQPASQQPAGQSLQNAPAPSREDCLAMGISACN